MSGRGKSPLRSGTPLPLRSYMSLPKLARVLADSIFHHQFPPESGAILRQTRCEGTYCAGKQTHEQAAR
jgi:hypothetical protein